MNIKALAVDASNFIGECFDSCKHLLDKDNMLLDSSVRFVSSQLYLNCHLSSESSLILIIEDKEWDAEIINRSIFEGTVKYLYIISSKKDEQKEKVHEYWRILPRVSAVTRHQKAKNVLDTMDGYDNPDFEALKDLLLTEEEIIQYRFGLNKNERKTLSQKWSFSKIINEFSTSKKDGLEKLTTLSHTYGLSSHLIHKDGVGTGIIYDRSIRSPEEQALAKSKHSSKIISDVCLLAQLRSMYLLRACDEKEEILAQLISKYSHLFDQLNKT